MSLSFEKNGFSLVRIPYGVVQFMMFPSMFASLTAIISMQNVLQLATIEMQRDRFTPPKYHTSLLGIFLTDEGWLYSPHLEKIERLCNRFQDHLDLVLRDFLYSKNSVAFDSHLYYNGWKRQ